MLFALFLSENAINLQINRYLVLYFLCFALTLALI